MTLKKQVKDAIESNASNKEIINKLETAGFKKSSIKWYITKLKKDEIKK